MAATSARMDAAEMRKKRLHGGATGPYGVAMTMAMRIFVRGQDHRLIPATFGLPAAPTRGTMNPHRKAGRRADFDSA
jgi:hypothetical protein